MTNLATLLGVRIEVYDGTKTETVLKRRLRFHKRSRRWHKKFCKRYGTEIVSRYIIPNGKSIKMNHRPLTLMMNPNTYQHIMNHPEMKKYEMQDPLGLLGGK